MDNTKTSLQTEVAEALWMVLRECEDKCDLELEDVSSQHVVWQLANIAIGFIQSPPAVAVTEGTSDFVKKRDVLRALIDRYGTCRAHAVYQNWEPAHRASWLKQANELLAGPIDEAIEALAAHPAAGAVTEPVRHATKQNGDCPHWCKACAIERDERAGAVQGLTEQQIIDAIRLVPQYSRKEALERGRAVLALAATTNALPASIQPTEVTIGSLKWTERYYLTTTMNGEKIEREVSMREFIAAEQAAGFRSKTPGRPATGGFGSGAMGGRVVSTPILPASNEVKP